ncbi:MAG: hypothetical protein ACYC6Y_11880 [Thermoguttaceae bacterium]
MPPTDTISQLNRLYHLMLRSFAAYSMAVRPLSFPGPEGMLDLVREIAGQHGELAGRIAETIRTLRGAPDPTQYPITFTAWNDVGLPRVLEHMAEHLEKIRAEARTMGDGATVGPVLQFSREVVHLAERQLARLAEALARRDHAA